MNPIVHDWLNLIVRWAHVIAAIMWIGDSFLFMWLDSHLRKDDSKNREGDVIGELWMAHGGGFYELVKRRSLSVMPEPLYSFKWESYSTWITGFLLLIIVYYLGGKAMLLDSGSGLSHVAAVHISLGLLLAGLGVYHVLCMTPVVKDWRVFSVVGFGLIAATAWGVSQIFSGRAMFLQIGAMIGTIMSSNVFFRIIPAQKHMLAMTRANQPVDTSYGLRAKKHSTHNHYLTLPVLFAMLSNHFPSMYGHQHAWLVLVLVMVVGAGVKRFMNSRLATPKPLLAVTVAALVTVGWMTGPRALELDAGLANAPKVSFATAQSIVQARCVSCHAAQPSNASFAAPPAGVMLETPEQLHDRAQRVYVLAVASRAMPLGNQTNITDTERALLGAWIAQGADVAAPGPVQTELPGLKLPAAKGFASPAEEAKDAYASRCASCHGAQGRGDGAAAQALNPKPRNFSDATWQAQTTDAAIAKVIGEGGAAVGKSALMPAQPDLKAKPAVMAELVKLIRGFGTAK
jgi:uncharacterized membrane protein